VTDQTPLSSFTIGVVVLSIPPGQSPVTEALVASGASSRKVTRPSGRISGDIIGGGPCLGAWAATIPVKQSNPVIAATTVFMTFSNEASSARRPLVSPWLIETLGHPLAPAYYIMLFGAIGLLMVWPMRETNTRALDE